MSKVVSITTFAWPSRARSRRVASRAELLSAGALGRLAQEPLLLRQDRAVAVLQLPEQGRRALDVGEEEGDGAGRKFHARRIQPDGRERVLLHRQSRPQDEAPVTARARLELAAVDGDALTHADEAMSAPIAVAAASAICWLRLERK